MYVVSFYSFKGGVGRTMSLVNVAAQIAQTGKRVLIVDFDLEAPGIPTFESFAAARAKPGLVEYINQYRNTHVAPDVSAFAYSAKKFQSGGEILVMPAGDNGVAYSAKLNSIDWPSLYAKEEGYLFFEDLKNQWRNTFSPDYVLIDSRTGHSDVEGICTRQLPDAVCFLFFPNEQNLQGLKRVVHNTTVERAARASIGAKGGLASHFVVSNVPDLDDEDGIVSSTLDRFKSELGYDSLAGEIHHYDSLSLLNQAIFSESRPNSRLTREYKRVADAIRSENLSDRDVALTFVKKTALALRNPGERVQFSIPIDKVERILSNFRNDPEITVQVALIYETLGRFTDALALLVDLNGDQTSDIYAIRARLHHQAGQGEKAGEDLTKMLNAGGAEVTSLLAALSIANQVKPEIFSRLTESAALASLTPDDRVFVALQLDDGENELPAKAGILESLFDVETDVPSFMIRHQLALTSIGLGRFSRAVSILQLERGSTNKADIADLFNLAMAKLGMGGVSDVQLFSDVVELAAKRSKDGIDANYAFCLAISNAAIGEIAKAREWAEVSREAISARPRREFSPWAYVKVSPPEFKRHLAEFEKQLGSGMILPQFAAMQQSLLK